MEAKLPGKGTATKAPPSGGSDGLKMQNEPGQFGPYGNDPNRRGFDTSKKKLGA